MGMRGSKGDYYSHNRALKVGRARRFFPVESK